MHGNRYLKRTICGLVFFCLLSGAALCDRVEVVEKPPADRSNDHYIGNRAPLAPSVLIKLPVGSIMPGGWLLKYFELQRDGLTGNLGKISAWLQKEDNAWLSEDGHGEWGWEEVPYWLKGYANIGYILGDEEIIREAKVWTEGAINSRREDGNFGPVRIFDDDGSQDFWANMVMLFCLQSYYEYSGDRRVIDLMTDYFRYQLSVPDDKLLTHYWQHLRGGDNLYSVFWLYNRTGEPWLLELAEKIHRNTADWKLDNDLPDWHNVNIAQGFREPATYSILSRDPADLRASYDNFRIIRDLYGQVPGGMFGGDEISRPGYSDPRQGIETCGMVEQMLSDEIMAGITGDVFWADNAEDVAFNNYPAAVMPDFRALRYITCPNMATSDWKNHAPGIYNTGSFMIMNPLSNRCCQHNHSHGWPYYSEHILMATPDNGVAAVLYGPAAGSVRVGGGSEITITEETVYPFEETILFRISAREKVAFPLYLRVPGWCDSPAVSLNGGDIGIDGSDPGGKYIRIDREWNNGDTVELRLPMKIGIRTWTKNHNSVSVNYGPLTFSLRMKERYIKRSSKGTALWDSKWQKGLKTKQWPAFDILSASPWNYGLVLDGANPADSFEIIKRDWPEDDFPFALNSVPIALKARGKIVQGWTLDKYGLVAPLQDSPVKSDAEIENLILVPMGAARLRISAFPVIGEGPDAHRWTSQLQN
ncbi:MAG TPA: glycoside hydrolase family 127 protein [bacterium]|nr:glycoside hydrolase family 127 protein [bacterium]